MIFPLFWMISTSPITLEEANSPGIVWIPESVTFQAFIDIFNNHGFLRAYFNLVFTVTIALVGTVLTVVAVAYAFSRMAWSGRNVLFFLMMATIKTFDSHLSIRYP